MFMQIWSLFKATQNAKCESPYTLTYA